MNKHILFEMKRLDSRVFIDQDEMHRHIDEYFELTGEDKQSYIDATEDSAWIIY